MILVIENGRLGNQLFQYFGLRQLFPNEKIILLGFSSFNDIIKKDSLENCYIFPFKSRVILLVIMNLFIILARTRLVGRYEEINRKSAYKLKKKKGLIDFISIITHGDFQHISITINFNLDGFQIKDEITDRAKTFLERCAALHKSNEFVFVHIRRGDYIRWPHPKFPAVLSYAWYRDCIKEIQSVLSDPVFIIVTDDIPYAIDWFSGMDSFVISNNPEHIDLAIMGNCAHGILSASSFSWWGGFLLRSNAATLYRNSVILMAPLEWSDAGGSEVGINYPSLISNWMTTRSRKAVCNNES